MPQLKITDLRTGQTTSIEVVGDIGISLATPAPAPIQDPDPTPAPPPDTTPAPSPSPAPEPAPAPPPVVQILPTKLDLNPSRQLLFVDYQADSQAYDRNDDLLKVSAPVVDIGLRGADTTNSGADRTLLASLYQLRVDGAVSASFSPAAGAKRGKFSLNLTPIPHGWHWMTADGEATETAAPWYFFKYDGEGHAQPTTMPVVMGSHELNNMTKGAAIFYAEVPSKFEPVMHKLKPRETPAFSDTIDRRNMVQVELVPVRNGDLYRPRVDPKTGIVHTCNQEPYYWSTLEGNETHTLAALDGPRGKGNVSMATHLQIGRTATYFCDGFRIGKVTADGTVITLLGYRHKTDGPAPRVAKNNDAAQFAAELFASQELIGDWSAVAKKGLHACWGFSWDQSTLGQNNGVPAIPNNGTLEQPHVTGPRLLVADTKNNRVLVATFDPASHETPAKVTELITGLADPWDCVCDNGILYVSERMANRIAAYDATTGAFLRVVVSGASGLAIVDQSRFVGRVAPIADIRAQPCVLPEGLYCQDGWLYFGSIAMGQVRRVNLDSGAIEVVVPDIKEYSKGGTNFCKIAVSDGSFGPRGTVFLVTWSIANQGRPKAWLPNGTEWAWAGVGAGLSGPGRAWETIGYGSSVAVGQGRLVCGTSAEGIVQHSKALPTDALIKNPADPRQTPNDYWVKLRTAYESRGLLVTHGPGGWGYYGLPKPYGIDPDVDAFLRAHELESQV